MLITYQEIKTKVGPYMFFKFRLIKVLYYMIT